MALACRVVSEAFESLGGPFVDCPLDESACARVRETEGCLPEASFPFWEAADIALAKRAAAAAKAGLFWNCLSCSFCRAVWPCGVCAARVAVSNGAGAPCAWLAFTEAIVASVSIGLEGARLRLTGTVVSSKVGLPWCASPTKRLKISGRVVLCRFERIGVPAWPRFGDAYWFCFVLSAECAFALGECDGNCAARKKHVKCGRTFINGFSFQHIAWRQRRATSERASERSSEAFVATRAVLRRIELPGTEADHAHA